MQQCWGLPLRTQHPGGQIHGDLIQLRFFLSEVVFSHDNTNQCNVSTCFNHLIQWTDGTDGKKDKHKVKKHVYNAPVQADQLHSGRNHLANRRMAGAKWCPKHPVSCAWLLTVSISPNNALMQCGWCLGDIHLTFFCWCKTHSQPPQ